MVFINSWKYLKDGESNIHSYQVIVNINDYTIKDRQIHEGICSQIYNPDHDDDYVHVEYVFSEDNKFIDVRTYPEMSSEFKRSLTMLSVETLVSYDPTKRLAQYLRNTTGDY